MTGIVEVAEVLAGVAIGAVVGLLGGGGAVLTVPLLVIGFDVDPRGATTTSLAVVAIASLVGLVVHGRARHVQWRTGAVVGGLGVGAAVVGSLLSAAVPGQVLLVAFTALLVVAGVAMVRPRAASADQRPSHSRLPRWAALLLVATGVGLVTGFLGVGGGFLVVPALVLMLGVPMSQAVGTSLLVLLINAAAGLVTRLVAPFPGVDVLATVLVTSGAAVGAVVGARLSARVPAETLRRVFGGLVLVVAVATAVQAARAA